jgi:peptide/nickel transport system ATP-binding protein
MNPPADNDSCIGIASALIFDPQFLWRTRRSRHSTCPSRRKFFLLTRIQSELKIAMIFITQDLRVASKSREGIIAMY